ncbi:MAG: hypothetical protein ACRDG8_11520 [Actinomycetota bacterium]
MFRRLIPSAYRPVLDRSTMALGPRATLGGSGLATVVLGAVACVLLLARRRKR